MTEDIKKLFSDSRKIEKPFVMVGAGLGAVNARFYAQMYPNEVAGIILVNPLYEGLFAMENGLWSKFWYSSYIPSWQSLHILAACGLVRVGLHLGLVKDMLKDDSLPEIIRNRQFDTVHSQTVDKWEMLTSVDNFCSERSQGLMASLFEKDAVRQFYIRVLAVLMTFSFGKFNAYHKPRSDVENRLRELTGLPVT